MKDKLNPLIVGGSDTEKLEAMLEILEAPDLEHEWKVITVSRELRKLLYD
jgi:hypothetical protein